MVKAKIGEPQSEYIEAAKKRLADRVRPQDEEGSEKIEPNIRRKSVLENGYVKRTTFELRNKYSECEEIFEAIRQRYQKSQTYNVEVLKLEDYTPPSITNRDSFWPQDKSHYNVLFSGGYDSLALTLRHLEKGEYVVPLYTTFCSQEKVFVQMILDSIRSVYPKLLMPMKTVFGEWRVTEVENKVFAQQPITAFSAASVDEFLLKNCIASEAGYCMNDTALSYLDELKALYNARLACTLHDYRPPLEFPYIKKSHYENSSLVEDFLTEHDLVIPITCLDNADVMRSGFSVHKKPIVDVENLQNEKKRFLVKKSKDCTDNWYLMGSYEEETRHENKECYNFSNNYIIHEEFKK